LAALSRHPSRNRPVRRLRRHAPHQRRGARRGRGISRSLSNGDPVATAAGAAGGVIVSETLHYAAGKQAEKAYATGYDKGKSDAVKQQYWLYVSMQRQRNQVSSVRLYPVQLPEQRIDGVTFRPSTKLLRIEE
jgi:hypothetical protein